MATTEQLLDLAPGIGQRYSDVRFDVLDKALAKVGEVHPDRDGVTVQQNTNRRINRDLTGLHLSASEQGDLDPFGHRLAPVWVLSNGAEFPLGVYIVGAMERERHEWGLDAEVPAVDQTLILDQPTEATLGYAAGTPIRDALVQQFTAAAVPRFDVDPSIETTLANPISWAAGQTQRLAIINELAALGGAYSAYFDNTGTGRVRRVPDLASTVPTLVYGSGGRILAGSMIETDDLLEAPNRWVVVDTSNPDAPVVGYYDLPDDAPHSFANRGFVIATTITEQGLGSVADANARAAAAAAQDHGTFEWVQFSSTPDPRHDTHDAVLYLGQVYREQGWQLPLTEGAEMRHDLRRVYGTGSG